MQYSIDFTIPANTKNYAPVRLAISPLRRILRNIQITFRAGSLGVVGVKVLEGGSQFAPWPTGWYYGNNQTVAWNGSRVLQGPPYSIVLEGYSDAIDWPHTVTFLFEFN